MSMTVKVYSTAYCGYCRSAKSLLQRLGIPFEEIDVTGDRVARARLIAMAHGRRTVPVIVIDGEVIGGYVELAKMASSGDLHRRQQRAEAAQAAEPGLRRAGS
jgi:glutaredoxin 3